MLNGSEGVRATHRGREQGRLGPWRVEGNVEASGWKGVWQTLPKEPEFKPSRFPNGQIADYQHFIVCVLNKCY